MVAASLPMLGQASGGAISGTVTDSTNAVIPNAQIVIKDLGTGVKRTLATDKAGFYNAPNLLPGQYQVSATAKGFKTAIQSGITLTVGNQQVANMKLSVGGSSETVQVDTQAATIELASSSVGNVVNQATIVDLPLNGRDWTSLATLQPGVEALSSIQANPGLKDRAHRGYGAQLSISGSRPQQNNYRIDGISVNDYTNGGPGSIVGATLGVDAIQEFSVLTSNYSTEYGRTSGGVVNALTKSGTNKFHGDVYEFARNSALDAKGYFDDHTLPIPAFSQNQFGAAIGGPIFRDHTFFFADYEGLRVNQNITANFLTPSAALRQGITCSIPQPDPGGCTTAQITGAANPDPATGIDKAVLPFLALYRLPNAGLVGNGDTGTFSAATPHITSENFYTARIDQNFSQKDTSFASFEFDPASGSQADPADNVLSQNKTGRSYVAVEETHIFNAQIVNSARIGFNRSVHTSSGIKALNPASGDSALGVTPGADNPQLDVPSIVTMQPGVNQLEKLDYWNNSYQAYDDLFITRGRNSLKAGFALEKIQLNQYDPAPANEYAFNSLYEFLQNSPSFLLAVLPNIPFPHFGIRSTIIGGYVQDDIRWKPNLTINVGLRYEISTVPSEKKGQLSVLTSPFNQSPSDFHIGNSPFQNPTFHNFDPRVGFAWDPGNDGKTAVHAGFGLFDVLPLPYFFGQIASAAAPFAESGLASTLNPGDFPSIALSKALVSPLRVPYVQQHAGRNYVMQWNLSVQHELPYNLTATVAYVGTRGVRMPFRSDDINTVQPIGATPEGYLWPNPNTTPAPAKISPNIGQMDALTWVNDSYFEGFESQVQKNLSHGFQFQGSYTWSRAIDSGDGSIASDAFLTALPGLFYFQPKTRRSISDFNVKHDLSVNALWTVPVPASLNGFASRVANGWQLGVIMQVRSGLPFTPLISGDPLGLQNYAPLDWPDRLRTNGCKNPVNPGNPNNYLKLNCFSLPAATPDIAAQCVQFGETPPGVTPSSPGIPGTCQNLLGNTGRNSVYGPGLREIDFSLVKETRIKDNVNLELRGEFFNVFNHPNFGPPVTNSAIFDNSGNPVGGAGLVDTPSTSSRQIQFAAKLIF